MQWHRLGLIYYHYPSDHYMIIIWSPLYSIYIYIFYVQLFNFKGNEKSLFIAIKVKLLIYTVMAKNIGTIGKYDQRRLWKLICIVNPFDLLFKKFTKIDPSIGE